MKTNLFTILLPIFFIACDNKDDTSVDPEEPVVPEDGLPDESTSQIVLLMQSKMVCMAL